MDWYVILIIAILAIAVVASIIWFVKLPSATKISNLKEWLKFAVVEAEKALGAGTGQLKLRMVYDMVVKNVQFSWVASLVSFDTFSGWVDEALDWMKKQLSENKAAESYVES